jgi:hypothetical protein
MITRGCECRISASPPAGVGREGLEGIRKKVQLSRSLKFGLVGAWFGERLSWQVEQTKHKWKLKI